MKTKSKQYLKGYEDAQEECSLISDGLRGQIDTLRSELFTSRNETARAKADVKTWTEKYNNVVFTMVRGVEQVTGIPLLFPKGAIKQ